MSRIYSIITALILIIGTIDASISLSHTEGKGLGYTLGYSSLDLFLAKPVCRSFVPFIDLRGHMFNNGRYATNAGAGLRWLGPCRNKIYGINFYYDTYDSSRLNYNQISLGLEALGEAWDMRANGYLPITQTNTPIYSLTYEFIPSFLAIAREQFAMGGIDTEVGYHFNKSLYASFGPYFYWGRSQSTENAFVAVTRAAIGARVRAIAHFFNYFDLEAVGSYDPCFNWAGQVTFSINLPFNWFCGKTEVRAPCCLKQNFYRPVIRNEIIIVDKISRFSSNPAILDPEFQPL